MGNNRASRYVMSTGTGESPPPEYEGPLDLVPGAVVAYSGARACGSSWLGDPVYTIKKTDGGATQAFTADAVTGDVDAAAIATFVGAAGTVDTLNDQSGSGEDLGADIDLPPWIQNAMNSHPGFGASSGQLTKASGVTIPAGAIKIVVAADFEGSDDVGIWASEDSANPAQAAITVGTFGGFGGGNDSKGFARMTPAASTDETSWSTTDTFGPGPHVIEYSLLANGNVTIKVDGVDKTAVKDSGDAVVPPGCADAKLSLLTTAEVELGEVYLWSGASDVAAAVTNMMTYYLP